MLSHLTTFQTTHCLSIRVNASPKSRRTRSTTMNLVSKKKMMSAGVVFQQKNYGADQQRLQISDLHFDKFPTPATFACWKIRFKTEVCTCSQFPTEAMQWIKEVELVDSVDELRSPSSTRGISMPNFEARDARIASALNKIIHNSQFKVETVWRNKKPKSRTVSFVADRLLT